MPKIIDLNYLIDIGEKKITVSDNFNMERLINVLPSLHKLNNIIGMEAAKLTVCKIIIFYTVNLCDKNKDMMHTMIQGCSGTGKTMLARIIGEIYWKLGILDDDATTHNVVDEANNGVQRQLRKKQKVEYNEDNIINSVDNGYDYNDGFLASDDDLDDDKSYTSSKSSESTVINNTYKFIEASRTDCIDKYQGGTATKTSNLIKSALGGVLFIDEAYSLGNSGHEDSYNKECIDTLTSLMEKYKGKVIIILGGYKQSMEDALLKYNEGLARRITFTITIDGYSAQQLGQIFVHMVKNISVDDLWTTTLSTSYLTTFFNKNMSAFPHYGGDIESLLFHIKLIHGTRLLHAPLTSRKCVNKEDLLNGFQDYLINRVP